ncbi:MAG TPA: TonB-dependent receptor, partial [Burkholderiaceae bacterium]
MLTLPARTPLACAIAALFAFVTVTAHAEKETAKPMEAPLQKVEVTGNAQTYDARRDDTATKIVLTGEEMQKHGDTTIAEALKRLPGITVGGAPGRGTDIRMRGLGNGYTQILLNGEPVPAGFSLDTVAPETIERIEVMRAATADLSAQAIAGAINIILKKAVKAGQRELRLGGSMYAGIPNGSVTYTTSDRNGPLSYSLTATLSTSNGEGGVLSLETTTGVDGRPLLRQTFSDFGRADAINLNLAPRVNWTIEPGETLTVQPFLSFTKFDGFNRQSTSTVFGTPPRFPVSNSEFGSRIGGARTDFTWAKTKEGGAKTEVKYSVNYAPRDSYNDIFLRSADRTLRVYQDIDNTVTDLSHTLNGKLSLPLEGGHALAFGVDGTTLRRRESRGQIETSPLPNEALLNLDEAIDVRVTRLATFVQDEWNVTPRWSVYLGLRWEGILLSSENNGGTDIDNRSSVLSPIFQTLWKLPDTKSDQIRFAAARTYKAPQPFQAMARRIRSANNSFASPDFSGNPRLRPELAWGLDLSYEHYLEGGGLLSASSYLRQIEDLTRNQLSYANGLWTNMPTNVGTALTRGVELEAKLPLKTLLADMPAIEMRANLARNWSKVSGIPGPDNRLDDQTPLSSTVGLDYKYSDTVTAGGSFTFVSGGDVRRAVDEWGYAGARRTLDLYAQWKFDPKMQLRLSYGNVLRQDWEVSNWFVDAGQILRRDR